MSKYVIIRDMSAGNDSVGEMWQETKIFDENSTLKEVMDWAHPQHHGSLLDKKYSYSRKRVTITKPHGD